MFVNVLLCETAKEDTVEAGVQPAQVDSTDVADAGLGLEHREENENQHKSSERNMQGEPGGPSTGAQRGWEGKQGLSSESHFAKRSFCSYLQWPPGPRRHFLHLAQN